MKHKIFLFFFISLMFNSFSQTQESLEVLFNKNNNLLPLGASNGSVYFYARELHKPQIRVTVYKFSSSTLELLEIKDVFIKDYKPKEYIGRCNLEMTFKNNKFHIFYSLLHERNYHVYVKTLNEDFSNETTQEIGQIFKTGYELLGDLFVSYSPDSKTALLVLKNYCEKEQMFTNLNDIYEKTEFLNYDMVNGKVLFKKSLPVEMDGDRLLTSDYKMNNNGDIFFAGTLMQNIKTTLYERTYGITAKSVIAGYIESQSDNLAYKIIDLKGFIKIIPKIWLLNNGNVILTLEDKNQIKINYFSILNKSKNFDKLVSHDVLKQISEQVEIENVVDAKDGLYIVLRGRYGEEYKSGIFAVMYMTFDGVINWTKPIDYIKPLYKGNSSNGASNSIVYNNKLYLFYIENRSYELSDDTNKLKEEKQKSVKGSRNDTKMLVIDENQHEQKQLLHDNQELEMRISEKEILKEGAALYLALKTKKVFKIKKVELN